MLKSKVPQQAKQLLTNGLFSQSQRFASTAKYPARDLHPLTTEDAQKYKNEYYRDKQLKLPIDGYAGPFYRSDIIKNSDSIVATKSLDYGNAMYGQGKAFCWYALDEAEFKSRAQSTDRKFTIFAVKASALMNSQEDIDKIWQETMKVREEAYTYNRSAMELSFSQSLTAPKDAISIEPIARIESVSGELRLQVLNQKLFDGMMDKEKLKDYKIGMANNAEEQESPRLR